MHPIAFQFGPLTVTWYGIMVAMGFIAGLWTASRRGPRGGIAPDKVLDLGPWLIIGAIIGARFLYVVSYWHEEFAGRPTEIFKVWRGGLVFYGGFIGACLACILYARLKKVPLWKLADVMAPSIPLGSAFGRIGCLMNGCCYGRECHSWWAITFPSGVPHPAPSGVPLHPTQLYDSLLNLAFYFFLAWFFGRRKFDGQVFAVFLLGYALIRSFVEIFRGDYPQHYLGGWATPAHLVSIGIFIIGLVLMVVLPRLSPAPQPALPKKPAENRSRV